MLVERAGQLDIQFLDARDDLCLTLRLINPKPQFLLDPANSVRAPRTPVEQSDDDLVDLVDLFAQRLDAQGQLFSHRTYRSTSANNPDERLCSAMTLTSALPTTAASA